MTKEELIDKMAADAKTTKVQARAALESLMESVKKTLKKVVKFLWLVSEHFQFQKESKNRKKSSNRKRN